MEGLANRVRALAEARSSKELKARCDELAVEIENSSEPASVDLAPLREAMNADTAATSTDLIEAAAALARTHEAVMQELRPALDEHVGKTASALEVADEAASIVKRWDELRDDIDELTDVCSDRSPVSVADALTFHDTWIERFGEDPLGTLAHGMYRHGLLPSHYATEDEIFDVLEGLI